MIEELEELNDDLGGLAEQYQNASLDEIKALLFDNIIPSMQTTNEAVLELNDEMETVHLAAASTLPQGLEALLPDGVMQEILARAKHFLAELQARVELPEDLANDAKALSIALGAMNGEADLAALLELEAMQVDLANAMGEGASNDHDRQDDQQPNSGNENANPGVPVRVVDTTDGDSASGA